MIDMRNALVFYFATRAPGYTGKKFGYKTIADSYHVPRETFRRRLSGPLKGFFGHIAGGHNSAQNFVSVSQPSILLTPIHLALPHNLSVGPSVISTPATAPVAPAVPALRRAPVAPAVPALRRARVAPAAAASPPAPVPVTTSHAGKQFSTFLLFQVSCRHGILFDNFSVSDIYTDESSSGSSTSGAHDLEAEMEEVERFAVDTAVLSEAPTILDSGATDKNNNNDNFWTPTLTKEDVKEDPVVISDEEEEGNGCEWVISYEEVEGNGCEWGSICIFFSV